ncbi:MAG: hypothetical protein GPJ54_10220 [Candidatus Heimdallarchaeota archaeon]|nr:hypothetical protein [Candidatus Heimdallarchaeota archaeon]
MIKDSFSFSKKSLLPFMLFFTILSLNNNPVTSIHGGYDINQTDSTSPTLTVFSPILGETHSSNKMKITLEARDETAWSNLRIRIGQIVLFDLDNTGGTLSSQDLVYTNEFIFLDRLFSLGDQPKLDNRTLSIKLTDLGNNVDQVFVDVDVDLEKPIVKFETSIEDLITTNTAITIEWKVNDVSIINSQQILLNGELYETSINLNEEIYSIDFELAFTVVKSTQFTFTVIATDSAGNVGRNSTSAFFQPVPEQGDTLEFDLQTLIVLLGSIFGFLIIVIFVIRRGREKTDKSLHKNWEGELIPPPLLELMEIQIKEDPSSVLQLTDLFSRIENTWNETAEGYANKSSITNLNMSDFIDTFNSNLMIELFSEATFSPEQFRIMEQKLLVWKSEIMLKPKPWKGKLNKPPLENIVDQYSIEKFTNYPEFVKTIEVLLTSWDNAAQRIEEMEQPTITQVKAILNDYESETIILLSKTQEFSRDEINEIDTSLNNWMQKIL